MEYTCYIIKRKNKASVSGGYTVGEGVGRFEAGKVGRFEAGEKQRTYFM